ncbi:hypothetical protein VMCG_05038 [Cytospora schulzeri]|uniref:Altered inheritance of mitochondria protein 9, mitochondrial n=1 Tax=Cytospora schulzeri TaxID=448051 RepID=A0A423WM34_9PEZI|nr:hypothetical protein VMCG_05038 [Valsa malicola]
MSLILTRLSKRPTVRCFCRKLLQQTYSSSSITKSSTTPSFNFGFDPYEYTNGRWLRADAAQRDARRVKFDFPALCQKAISSAPGAKGILKCSMVEGNFNRAFILRLDNGTKVVARVPFSIAGPPRLVTNSEVATMAYLREKTNIPIPQVLDWSDDPLNPVGTEYIIMEHVSGIQLQQHWPEMTSFQRMDCVRNLADLVKQMHDLDFPAYGSIYFNDGLVSSSNSVRLDTRFCIGPNSGSRYFPCYPTDRRFYNRKPPNRGPWKTFDNFTRGLLDAGISSVPDETPLSRPAFRGTAEEHMALLSEAEAVLQALSRDPRIEKISSPLLLHPDLHKRNIFVDPDEPTKITAVIDWQSTCIDPALLYYNAVPDLCEHPKGIAYDAMDSYDGVRDQTPEEVEAEDILRKEVAIFRIWAALGLPGSCPYQPTEEELAKHNAQWEDFEMALNLEKGLMNILSTDEEGFVPTDNWDVVKRLSDELLKKWLADADADEMGRDKAKQLWPFDHWE